MHMKCYRCKTEFCWSCMEKMSDHQSWYKVCPQLPYAKCTNILITAVVFLLMPLILLLVPIVYSFMVGIYFAPVLFSRCMRRRNRRMTPCCRWALAYFISVLLILPISIVLGAIASVFMVVIGLIPAWFLCISYIWRLTANTF